MIVAVLLVTHFVADFLLQSRDMGKKKSSEPKYLIAHLAIQYAAFTLVLAPLYSFHVAVLFSLSNAAIHGVIDWNLWRLYKASAYARILKIVAKKYGMWSQPPENDPNVKAEIAAWQYWEDHWFYTTIGFDQLLHGLTLVLLASVFHL